MTSERKPQRLHTPRRWHRGVTLVELMVGLVIGLIATLIITQVLSVAEGQKRSTTTGSDAQVNGALALYAVRRDVQMAGYGFSSEQPALGCDTHAQQGGVAVNWSLAPLTITDGAGGAPDTIDVLYSDKDNASLAAKVTKTHLQADTEFLVATSVGIAAGDVLIAVPSTIDALNWCTVLNATSIVDDAAGHHIAHATGAAGPWNTAPAASNFPVGGYPVGSYLIDAGQLVLHRYTVNTVNHTLTQAIRTTATGTAMAAATELYPEIVNLQAMYGKDTNGDTVVDLYDNVTPATAAEWAQVRAVRLAVVARSAQYEKDEVTSSEPIWNLGAGTTVSIPAATACGASKCVTLKIDTLADWKHYRYKVYDAVVPLRNVLWSQ